LHQSLGAAKVSAGGLDLAERERLMARVEGEHEPAPPEHGVAGSFDVGGDDGWAVAPRVEVAGDAAVQFAPLRRTQCVEHRVADQIVRWGRNGVCIAPHQAGVLEQREEAGHDILGLAGEHGEVSIAEYTIADGDEHGDVAFVGIEQLDDS
jgi:hypothetical protein